MFLSAITLGQKGLIQWEIVVEVSGTIWLKTGLLGETDVIEFFDSRVT